MPAYLSCNSIACWSIMSFYQVEVKGPKLKFQLQFQQPAIRSSNHAVNLYSHTLTEWCVYNWILFTAVLYVV